LSSRKRLGGRPLLVRYLLLRELQSYFWPKMNPIERTARFVLWAKLS
jgi:hypothetical protein